MRGVNVKPIVPRGSIPGATAMIKSDGNDGAATTLTVLRKVLLAILLLGMSGSATELILLKHTEDWRQWIPLIMIAAAISVLAWHSLNASALNTRTLRWLMFAFIAGGIAGVYFHYQGSVEFKLESNPRLSGLALFWAAIGSKAPPLLAPGALVQLGLLGWLYTYKHSALREPGKRGE